MTLVKNRPIPHKVVIHKKRLALHHRKSQNYAKAYYPYIPIVLIFGLAIALSPFISTHAKLLGFKNNLSALNAASEAPFRLDATFNHSVANKDVWIGIATFTLMLLSWFAVKHFRIIKNIKRSSGTSTIRFYYADVIIALFIALGFIFSKASGVIK